jgi:hypothetical protein
MQPLYLARIEDLGRSDFVKVDCAACHHVALLTPGALLKLGLSLQTKVLDLTGRVRCRGCGAREGAVVSIKWGRQSGGAALDHGASQRARLGAAAIVNAHRALD